MSEPIELTEEQFKLLKTMCENKVKFIALPKLQPDDDAETVRTITTHGTTLETLIKLGFVVDATDDFKNELKEDLKKGGRPYRMLKLTENAIAMFLPPEGVIN